MMRNKNCIIQKKDFSKRITSAILPLILVFALTAMSFLGCAKSPDESSGTEASREGTSTTEAETTLEPDTTEAEPTEEEEPTTEAEPTTEEETATEAAPPTEVPTTEEPTTEEPSTEEPTTAEPTTAHPTTEAALTINDIAFIGDSRTLTMAVGGRLEFDLIPGSSVFATWGGELHQNSAKNNALAAAAADRELAIFWYGINDVQSDPGQTLADQFLTNYRAIIDLYRADAPDSEIVILSILSTSVNEKDYYDGQEENIRTYNAKLAGLCAEEGYTYLDITSLFTGDECLAPGDYIHFSKEWYETRFLPTVLGALGIED